MPSQAKRKILCVCDQGNNRSVHFAHPLKYWGNDVIACGLNNSVDTLDMLFSWAELIIITQEAMRARVPAAEQHKVHVFEVGPDTYPRPFNPILASRVRQFLEQNRALLNNHSRGDQPSA